VIALRHCCLEQSFKVREKNVSSHNTENVRRRCGIAGSFCFKDRGFCNCPAECYHQAVAVGINVRRGDSCQDIVTVGILQNKRQNRLSKYRSLLDCRGDVDTILILWKDSIYLQTVTLSSHTSQSKRINLNFNCFSMTYVPIDRLR